jgi:hypothetical protein
MQPLGRRRVGSHATATNPDSMGDPQRLPPFFLSSLAMTCKQEKHKQRFRSFLDLPLHPFFFRSVSPQILPWFLSSSPSLQVAGGGTKRLLVFGFPSGLQAGGVAVSPLQWKAGRRELSLLPTG